MACNTLHSEMSQEFAQKLFKEGAALVLLNVPPATEIGIDMHSWNTGEKFKGIKMIPPGLHFIYYSAVSKQGQTAPRTGFFHHFLPKELLVKVYQSDTEQFASESAEQTERVRENLRNLDSDLGPYPLEDWRRWISLSQHINTELVSRVVPQCGVLYSVPHMIPVEKPGCSSTINSDVRKKLKSRDSFPSGHENSSNAEQGIAAQHHQVCSDSEGSKKVSDTSGPSSQSHSEKRMLQQLPELVSVPGTEFRWFELPKRHHRQGATPAEVTASGMDSSYTLEWLITKIESSGGRSEDLIGELQLSFLVFLVAECWVGWQRWRQLVELICRAEKSLLQRPEFFSTVISVLHFQIKEVPVDLFVDIVEHENFMAASLANLFANVVDSSCDTGGGDVSLPKSLVDRALKFKRHLSQRFGWTFDFEEYGENAPVVVEL